MTQPKINDHFRPIQVFITLHRMSNVHNAANLYVRLLLLTVLNSANVLKIDYVSEI